MADNSVAHHLYCYVHKSFRKMKYLPTIHLRQLCGVLRRRKRPKENFENELLMENYTDTNNVQQFVKLSSYRFRQQLMASFSSDWNNWYVVMSEQPEDKDYWTTETVGERRVWLNSKSNHFNANSIEVFRWKIKTKQKYSEHHLWSSTSYHRHGWCHFFLIKIIWLIYAGKQ